MSSLLQVDVEGYNELIKKITKLGDDKDKRRETLILLRQVAKPTLDAARTLAPVSKRAHWARGKKIQPGNLKKSLGNITGRSKTNPTIYVGARAKRKHDGWYAHFVHDGHEQFNHGNIKVTRGRDGRFKSVKVKGRFTKKSYLGRTRGASHKFVTGNPFLHKAYEQTKSSVTADAEKRFSKFLQRRIDKLSK